MECLFGTKHGAYCMHRGCYNVWLDLVKNQQNMSAKLETKTISNQNLENFHEMRH